MKRKTLGCLLLAGCAVTTQPAHAVVGALDPVPAATLLLPYFEVDLANTDGVNTFVAVANADQAPVIVHATLWTDRGVPTLDWNMYLTGYDVLTIDLRALFTTGSLPPTEHVNDGDGISPVGSSSLVTDPATGVGPGSTSCNGQLPLPGLPQLLIDHIRNAHRGLASAVFQGRCAAVPYQDQIARGYITFDSVNFCTLDFPSDAGYFINGGVGQANNKNALLGDFVMLNPSSGHAHGDTLVHIEADSALGAANYTFYRRYSGGADNRESLATTFWARFTNLNAQNTTRLIAWRDSKRTISSFPCGTTPAPFPIEDTQIAIFDEDENGELPLLSLIPFPWETGSVQVGGPHFWISPTSGWLYLNLNLSVVGSQVPFGPVMQNYVGIVQLNGSTTVGLMAFPLDSALSPLDVDLPVCDGDPDPPACVPPDPKSWLGASSTNTSWEVKP